eukprot:5121288-Amphidinium_carterae.1
MGTLNVCFTFLPVSWTTHSKSLQMEAHRGHTGANSKSPSNANGAHRSSAALATPPRPLAHWQRKAGSTATTPASKLGQSRLGMPDLLQVRLR